jgi:hypothetical protein
MAIKFRKETVKNEFGDSKTRWWFDAGTEFLPAVYAMKQGYSWEIYDADGKSYTCYLDYFSRLRNRKDVVRFIETYDEKEKARIQAEKDEVETREREYKERVEKEDYLAKSFLQPINNPNQYNIGDKVKIVSSVFNKECNIGETLYTIFVEERFNTENAEIVGKFEFTNEEFDKFCFEFGHDRNDYPVSEEGNTKGGCYSDDPRLAGMTIYQIMNDKDLKEIFYESSFQLVNVVTAPNRKPIFVNTEGYNYARYVGIEA